MSGEQVALGEIQWRSPEFLHYDGGLGEHNVLEYFALSPFYDRRSNNEIVRMQTQFSSLDLLEQHLKNMKGIEFVVIDAKPPIFVIQKRNRVSPDQATPLQTYFVFNENIYMAPFIKTVLSSRLLDISRLLLEAVSTIT